MLYLILKLNNYLVITYPFLSSSQKNANLNFDEIV